MDHYSYLIDPHYRFLLIGIVLLVMAVVFTLTGETFERFHGILYRAERAQAVLVECCYVLFRWRFVYRALLVQDFKLRHYQNERHRGWSRHLCLHFKDQAISVSAAEVTAPRTLPWPHCQLDQKLEPPLHALLKERQHCRQTFACRASDPAAVLQAPHSARR